VAPREDRPPGLPGGPLLDPEALQPKGEYVREVVGGQVVGVGTPKGLSLPEKPGLRTVKADNNHSYRSLTRQAPDGDLLEVGTDLKPAEDRVASLRNRLLLLGGIGVALVGGLSWWLAGVALGPLRSLRDAAGRVSSTRDLSHRLTAEGAPEEVGELAGSVNAMLGRLERSAGETDAALEATRRFAGDAGHELRTPMTALRANLGALRRNPDLDPSERRHLLEDAEREADRAARLLEVLQTLARGDAGAALPRETIDLAGVAESAIEAARSRHPENDWRLQAPPEDLQISGWPDGLRALIDNLLENAARHGRPGGEVRTELARGDGALVLTVDDDGPGVETAERERIFERFARGNGAGSAGYGLGLALVRQQARLHGGEASVSESPLGGARFEVRLGASP
jgi:two-component system sensor histidine kinase PrrB